jgi:Bacterial alpha-L-rhamnosidase.
MAKVLGKDEDARYYEQVYANIKHVYNKYLIGEDGVIEPGHQAPYVRVLTMDLSDDKKKPVVLKQLLKEVEEANYSLNTGFLSTPFLLPVLAENGYVNEAYKILENETLPGWLYPIKKGMTTIPESWGGIDLLEDSLNHYSYGAVCEFMFQYIAGIRIDEKNPGYKEFILKPVVGGSLDRASASIKTHYGEIKSSWNLRESNFHYKCKVPTNTKATVILPDGTRKEVGSGTYEFECKID